METEMTRPGILGLPHSVFLKQTRLDVLSGGQRSKLLCTVFRFGSTDPIFVLLSVQYSS